MEKRILLRGAVTLAAVLFATLALSSQVRSTLYAPTFLTGWILTALVGLVALQMWFLPQDAERLARRASRHMLSASLVLGLLLLHLRGWPPRGWIETALFALLVAFLISAGFGAAWITSPVTPAERERRANRWLRVHLPLVWALLALGLFHGVFAHSHGLLAHYFLSGEPG